MADGTNPLPESKLTEIFDATQWVKYPGVVQHVFPFTPQTGLYFFNSGINCPKNLFV